MFSRLDGKAKSTDLFSSLIEKQLRGDASAWMVVEFDKIPNLNFPFLTEDVIENLRSDQDHVYKISVGVISGNIQDVCDLKIGSLCHAKWITLPCLILRFKHPKSIHLSDLSLFPNFANAFFPSWFQITKHYFIADGAKHYFHFLARVKIFSDDQVR